MGLTCLPEVSLAEAPWTIADAAWCNLEHRQPDHTEPAMIHAHSMLQTCILGIVALSIAHSFALPCSLQRVALASSGLSACIPVL